MPFSRSSEATAFSKRVRVWTANQADWTASGLKAVDNDSSAMLKGVKRTKLRYIHSHDR